jgi:hypothetical protein
VAVWCKVALDTPSLQVGHGHVESMGLKSFACFPSSNTSNGQGRLCYKELKPTEIEWAIEGQCHTEPSCSRRKNAVGLGEYQTSSTARSLYGGFTHHIDPQRDANQ